MSPSVEPDAIVRTALHLLPIPPHGDDFWSRLEESLDAEVPVPLPVEPRPSVLVADPAPPAPGPLERDTSLTLVPPAFRRASNAVLVVVAAAAVVVVAIAGSALMDERRGGGGSSEGSSPDAALETLLRDARDGATVTPLSDRNERSSTEAVLAWVADLGQGDAAGAWDAMGDTSQGHFASAAQFEATMPEMAEGYGAWSEAAPEDVLVTPVLADDDGTIAVVTLVGTVEQEGTPEVRADAFPVLLVDGEVVLEPFASAGDLEVVVPVPASDESAGYGSVGLDEELVFVLPTSAEAPVLRLDSGDTVVCGEAPGTDLYPLEGAAGQRCSYLPEGGFGAGDHLVTVAFVGADGTSVTAGSLRFAAA